MKTFQVPSYEDTLTESFNPRQVPESDFERALLRGYLQSHTGDFNYSYQDANGELQFGLCKMHIGDEWDEQGRLRSTFTVESPGGWNINKMLHQPLVEIFFSIEERKYPASEAYRVIINWELGQQVAGREIGKLINFKQSNHWPNPPVIGLTNTEIKSL